MQLKKLDLSFYADNAHLKEALDLAGGKWDNGKTRGYGIVVISVNGLTFGIPLRSNIRHNAAYITVRASASGANGKGLDYSKAVLLSKPSYVSPYVYKIPKGEHDKLRNKTVYITEKFEKYVAKYIKAVSDGDHNILNSDEYRFSTLQNYHAELGL